MLAVISNVNHIRFEVEDVLEDQIGCLPLPFIGMDKSGSAICKQYKETGLCKMGQLCPFRHLKGDKTIVCKHWLRGLCKKGDDCEFLHEYDMTRMPECFFFSKYNACNNKECPFLHIDPESKLRDCPWYDRGFCKHGPNCKNRHVRRVICQCYVNGFCPDGKACKFVHPKYDPIHIAMGHFPVYPTAFAPSNASEQQKSQPHSAFPKIRIPLSSNPAKLTSSYHPTILPPPNPLKAQNFLNPLIGGLPQHAIPILNSNKQFEGKGETLGSNNQKNLPSYQNQGGRLHQKQEYYHLGNKNFDAIHAKAQTIQPVANLHTIDVNMNSLSNITCHFCGQTGHKLSACTKAGQSFTSEHMDIDSANTNHVQQQSIQSIGGAPRFRRTLEEVTCYRCGEKGHFANRCPQLNDEFHNSNRRHEIS